MARSRTRPAAHVRTGRPRSRLRISTIADWVRAHRQRTGEWPSAQSGAIPGSDGDTWGSINGAFVLGSRGLPGGSSLEEFLHGYRYNPLPHLRKRVPTLEEVRDLAERHHRRTGRWPHQHSGIIPDTGGLTWMALDIMLRNGLHDFPGGSSLSKVLRKRPGSLRNLRSLQITPELILEWADAFHERTGVWPTARSGPIPESPGTTWQAVMTALHSGGRGFKGGTTLGQFLARHRDVSLQPKRRTLLTVPQILAWADEHFERTGNWPIRSSGAIPHSNGETWDNIANALYQGSRGLTKGSLAKLLAVHRGVRNRGNLPPLSPDQIIQWATGHFYLTGKWPTRNSGPISGTRGETWSKVCSAMDQGRRGLRAGMTLTELIEQVLVD